MSYIQKQLQKKKMLKRRRSSRIALELKKSQLQSEMSSGVSPKSVDHMLNKLLEKPEEKKKKQKDTFLRMHCSALETQDPFLDAFTPKHRRFAAFAWILPDKMCLFGGETELYAEEIRNDLYSFNTETKVWNTLSPFPGRGRTKHSMICRDIQDREEWQKKFSFSVFAKELIVFGGLRGFTDICNEVLAYNFDELQWRIVPCVGSSGDRTTAVPGIPAPVFSHTALHLPKMNAMLVFGGENPNMGSNNHIYMLHFTSNERFEWRYVKPKSSENVPMSRSAHTALLIEKDRKMIVFGGVSISSKKEMKYLNDTWIYTIDKNQWEKMETTGDLPRARFGHAAAIWKNYMFVFGGGVPFMKGLSRLNLKTMVWETIHVDNHMPSPRYGHIMYSRPGKHPRIYLMGGSGYKYVESEQTISYFDDFHCFDVRKIRKVKDLNDYSNIQDNYESLDEVAAALKKAGLYKANLIIGIDYTFSNTFQGEKSYGGKSLHSIEEGLLNPYQQCIQVIGRTLESFDDDGCVPVYGFGDIHSKDKTVFKISPDGKDAQGFREVLELYNQVTPTIQMSGPTNFAPLIRRAIAEVKETGEYTILLIIADGQVTEEKETISVIIEASHYPLSLVLVGVGDGPFDAAEVLDDKVKGRLFDNFQFVEFEEVKEKAKSRNESVDILFALEALMEIPDQYSALQMLGLVPKRSDSDSDSSDESSDES